ncbi:response regulator [Aurantimonas sp. VKM B-3413]|uniref:response regulator n=1 Tax=Aurantimonas sp. VKM B-3413 TaxID=2779401 RepID=UPI001E5AF5E5|nr:response regulator [Aurantimonas sp. VKM B-3413]MCB8838865.1 hypothetical protein [Aurantimonas sp. VKM B-3413]
MKILIVEDEPIIALDLEEIVQNRSKAEVLLASNLLEAFQMLDEGVDFALLDINLGCPEETSLPLAQRLLRDQVPFCFVSSSLDRLPESFGAIPQINKPFEAREVENVLPLAA